MARSICKPAAFRGGQWLMLLAVLTVLVGCSATRTALEMPRPLSAPPPSPAEPLFERVLIVVLENQDFEDAIRQSYLASLVPKGFLLREFHGLYHPSYPNYLAMISGRERSTRGDKQADLADTTIGDRLKAAGRSWRNYAQGYPGGDLAGDHESCYKESTYGPGRYARKHVPFLSYLKVDPESCLGIVNASEFDRDYANKQLPTYMFYSPDLDNDGHDPILFPETGLKKAAVWLQGFLDPILADSGFLRRTLIVVTFDESRSDGRINHIFTLLLGGGVVQGESSLPYDHFDVLRTIEWNFGLQPLAGGDGAAHVIADAWQAR